MKSAKPVLAVIFSLITAMMLAICAFAAEISYTITAPNNGHTYEVYQIFTGDYSEGILSNIKWGSNGTGTKGEVVNKEIIDTLTKTNEQSDTEKLQVISSYWKSDSTALKTVTNGGSISVEPGYYLIKDVDGSQEGNNDSYTHYLVEVVGDVMITPKSAVPEFEKKVQDVNDTTGKVSDWQDSADYDIGDEVPFLLSGTVAQNYENYSTYQFVFHDRQSEGLTFLPDTVTVKVDGAKIENDQYEVITNGMDDSCTFEIRFKNLKEIPQVKAGSKITVEYRSQLNENAVIGEAGNPNQAYLEFSNNPNEEEGSETGKTPEDTVRVFTYQLEIHKVDADQKDLKGAAFKLEKLGKNGYYMLVKEWEAGENVTFLFSGLDDGTYRLTETKTPAGYNTIEPIVFQVTAQHEEKSDDPKLVEVKAESTNKELDAASKDGILKANIVNNKGAILPETGGIGTTIFYTAGTLLVASAGVALAAKRRSRES